MTDPAGERLDREIWSGRLRLGWLATGIGALVVVASIGFLIPIFLDPGERNQLGLMNAPVVVVLAVGLGLFATRIARREQSEALAWLIEGREPDEREHRLTLRLALSNVYRTAVLWAIAGVLAAAINLTHSPGFAALVLATIWLGAETTCAVVYLASERIFRPATALALQARMPSGPIGPGIRARLLFAWALGTGVPVLGVAVIGVVGLTKPGVDTEYIAAAAAFLGTVALAVGMLAAVLAARAIADPVTAVRRALEKVERGELDAELEVDDGSEVGLLQAGFNRMADGLREREQIRDLFGRHVGRDVASIALRDGTKLGGEERDVAALFIDIVGSTSMALAMPPAEVVRLLNLFFRSVVDAVESEGGLVNKFEGDAALCVFGAPVASDDPAGDALRAARRLADRLAVELPQLDFGIGVSAGPAVAGNVGAEHRLEYTVIGDPVNEAARLCDLAKQHPGRVLASEAALQRSRNTERDEWSVGESTVLRGRDEPTGLAAPTRPARPTELSREASESP
jgi:adenylate cyclase